MNILTTREIRELAVELARGGNETSAMNDAYHRHITGSWMKSRGGMEMGAWDAWQAGWKEGLKLRALTQLAPEEANPYPKVKQEK